MALTNNPDTLNMLAGHVLASSKSGAENMVYKMFKDLVAEEEENTGVDLSALCSSMTLRFIQRAKVQLEQNMLYNELTIKSDYVFTMDELANYPY